MFKKALIKVIVIFAKSFFKATLFLAFHLCNFIASLFDWITDVLNRACCKNGIFITCNNEDNIEPKLDSKFTDDQLKVMAKNIPSEINKLEDIKDYYSVSYRQARRIKSALDNIKNTPDIRSIYA